jgi:hypothetical protein
MARERPIDIVLRAPMQFVAQDGAPVHAPLVLATIGAFQTRLILDTGSDVHLLTAELAREAGFALEAVDTGTDHAGASMDSWLVGDVPITLDDAEGEAGLVLPDVVAIPAPEAFSRQGIGGALSPQRLHATAFAVIDEIADEISLVEGDVASIREWLVDRDPATDVLALERRPGIDVPVVQAAIRPFDPVAVLVNTGGRHTEFEPGVLPGLGAAALERIGTGVSGAAVMGGRAGNQVLEVGGHTVEVAELMLRSGIGDPPAMIGQDLLRGSVIAVGPDPSSLVLWQVRELDAEVSGDRR